MPGQDQHTVVTALSTLQASINADDGSNKATVQTNFESLRVALDRIGLTVRRGSEVVAAS